MVLMLNDEDQFPLELTAEELAFGFSIMGTPSGTRLVAVDLDDSLRAVKVLTPEGTTEYVVCTSLFRRLYSAASSVNELDARFRRRQR